MTIQQTIEIPANRRVRLDFALPESFGSGMAAIKLSIKAAANKKATFTALLGDLYGSLKDSPHFGGDSMDIQREIRGNAW
jgi:hypothetical protein